jgi:hypothetical protein
MPDARTGDDRGPGKVIGREQLGGGIARRTWLYRAAGAAVGLAGFEPGWASELGQADPRAPRSAGQQAGGIPPQGPAPEDANTPRGDEPGDVLRRAEAKARQVTSRPLHTVQSAHYQAIGDAAPAFIKLTLSDCEQIALDYRNHFRARGFPVDLQDHRLSVIVFVDERPFLKFAENAPPGTIGFYSRPANWLVLFDFRNVPMYPGASGQSNMETVTHEATHQLTFNTGLLDRRDDIPLCIVEGLAMYGERRRLTGRSEPGQVNLRRLDELAHVQRRLSWISLSELLASDTAWFGRGEDRRALGYAESWVLVYHLMTDPTRLPQFRDYLRAIRGRKDRARRLEDARAHFGDLDQLDRELRRTAIRLQQTRG